MLTIIGMGKKSGDFTLNALEAIDSAKFLIVRSCLTECGAKFKGEKFIHLDELYDEAEDFDSLNALTVKRILEVEKLGDTVYLVDGDGYSDETAKILIEDGAKVIPGVGLGKSAALNLSAYEFVDKCKFIDTALSVNIFSLENALIAGEVKLRLQKFYGEEQEIEFCHRNKESLILIEDIDRQKNYDYSTSIFIKANSDIKKSRYTFADLLRIMERLSAPDGCEWDKTQTHESILVNILEEAYEAADAIISGDIDAMQEEIGDVLLQTVFQSDIASRAGEFDISDVITSLCDKLVTRHTHIFGKDKAANSGEALGFWEKAKGIEKGYESVAHQINLIPENFPALLRAEKIIKKAVKVKPITEKQLKEKIAGHLEKEEMGKLLMCVIALAVKKSVHAEGELLKVTQMFKSKFAECEKDDDVTLGEFLD